VPKAAPRSFRFGTPAAGALIFCATLLAYLPALRGGFIWDDNAHVTQPSLRSLDGLRRIWFLHSAFWVEHRLWGDWVVGYHLVNVLLHAAAACLVAAIMRRLAIPGAWLAGFIYALHPVHVESVAWISEQKNTLSAVLCLAAAHAYLGFDKDRRPSQYALALGLFLLSLLTKSVTATLPAALLVIFFWQRGRISWRRDALPLAPWLALGIAAGLFTAWVERTVVGADGGGYALSLPDRFLLAGRVIWFYLAKLAWPADLIFIYPRWNVDGAQAWQYLYPAAALALALVLWLGAARGRGRLRGASAAALAGFLIFVGTLFPALGFFNVFPFIYSYVADHFQYLASLGIIVPVSAGLALSAGRLADGSVARFLAQAAAAALLALLGALTWNQSGIYRNVQTLYTTTIERNPGCWMAHANLGVALSLMPGRTDDAIAQFEEAIRLNPHDAEAHNDLGAVWAHMPGREDDAIVQYQEALRNRPNFAGAHMNLGNALLQMPGRLDDAIIHYQEAIRLDPTNAEVHNNLANAWLRVPGRLEDAVSQCEEALRLDPDYALAHYNLGLALSRLPGRLGDAVAQYKEAIRLKPDYAEAHTNLAGAWLQTPGRLDDAIEEYGRALRLRPDLATSHYNLGLALSRAPGRLDEAVAQYEEAIRMRPDFAEAHNDLGAAYSAIPGRTDDALAQYGEALRLNPGYAPAWRNLGAARFNLGDMAGAADAFRAAVRLQPGSAEAHYVLGLALSRMPGRIDDAATQYREALRLAPDYPAAQAALADALGRRP
jgi:tetratricopeptide (TPR) repeat protein